METIKFILATQSHIGQEQLSNAQRTGLSQEAFPHSIFQLNNHRDFVFGLIIRAALHEENMRYG